MELPIYQVDAFTGQLFSGNPAAVVPLKEWLPDRVLQAIAAENNLSETAFTVPRGERFALRWFTPAVEVDLCGHATLAAAFVHFKERGHPGDTIRFESKGGALAVHRDGDLYSLDFPARPPERVTRGDDLAAALGGRPREVHASRDTLALFGSEEEVRALAPDFARLAALKDFAAIVTAPGREADFVSRFFAPRAGIPEDPVTGSAHCTLVPFWSRRLGKKKLRALQVSRRGGELFCEDRGARVAIAGRAVLYMRGAITV